MRRLLVIVICCLLTICESWAGAQTEDTSPRVTSAIRVEVPPILDGDVLGDPAWEGALIATAFVQNRPDEGQAASERTEVRIVFTEDTVYFGVVCYDRDPQSIIVTDSRRDSSLEDSDSFQIILDTFLDQQNGFVFGTSPSGQELSLIHISEPTRPY